MLRTALGQSALQTATAYINTVLARDTSSLTVTAGAVADGVQILRALLEETAALSHRLTTELTAVGAAAIEAAVRLFPCFVVPTYWSLLLVCMIVFLFLFSLFF